MGSSRRPLTPPSKGVAKKALISKHFAQNATLFGVGGEGWLVLVISPESPNTFDLHCSYREDLNGGGGFDS